VGAGSTVRPGSAGCRGGWAGGQPPGSGRSRSRVMAVVSSALHRPVPGRCRTVARPERMRRPAVDSSRNRNRLGSPPAGRMLNQGEHGQPGEQVAGQGDDGAPDPVLVEPVQRKVGRAGDLRAADPVLAAGPAAVPELQVGELPAGGVGRERGDPVPVSVGDPQLRPGVGAFLAQDDPHSRRPPREVEQGAGSRRGCARVAGLLRAGRRRPGQRSSGAEFFTGDAAGDVFDGGFGERGGWGVVDGLAE